MLFVSKIFLFAFLPLTLLGFYLTRYSLGRMPALALLFVASMFFYGYSYPPYVAMILLSYGVNYAGARALQRSGSRALLAVLLAVNLAYLGYFKYYDFFLQNVNAALGTHLPLLSIALPLGISFYTFQQIPYLVGAFQGQFKNVNFLKYIVVNSFFPHVIAGPIIWHREIAPQLERSEFGEFDASDFVRGLTFFAIGMFKKVVIADNVAIVVDAIFKMAEHGTSLTFGDAWLGAIAYGLQLYFDFSGYSEMAIGLALMFGIRFPINFFSPYKATSVIEFWSRWHMTMTRFFQEYVYVPLQFAVGRRTNLVILRYGVIFVMMFLVGLWHGAGWTWVLWGCTHGVLLIVNHAWRAARERVMPRHGAPSLGATRVLSWALTYLAVSACWVLFRAKDFASAAIFYKAMFFTNGIELPNTVREAFPTASNWLASAGLQFSGELFTPSIASRIEGWPILALLGLIAFVALMPNTIQIMGYFASGRSRSEFTTSSTALLNWGWGLRWAPRLGWAGVVSVLVVASLATILDDTAKSVFIYFNF